MAEERKPYKTPDEARAAGEEWVPREGEPADLSDPFHYQTPEESKAIGREWVTQDALLEGRGPEEHQGAAELGKQARLMGREDLVKGYGYDDWTMPADFEDLFWRLLRGRI